MQQEHKVEGNTQGVRKSQIEALEALFAVEWAQDEFAPLDLVRGMAAFTGETGREVSAYLKRDGTLVSLTVGDRHTVPLAVVHLRRNPNRLAGVRCLHTHPGGNAHLSAVDLSSLSRLKLDAMAAIGVKEDGSASALACAFLQPDGAGELGYHGPYGIYQIPQEELLQHIRELDAYTFEGEAHAEGAPERAMLIGLASSAQDPSLQELRRLTETAGAEVVETFYQPLRTPESATYIGSGKAQELALAAQALQCDLAIFDDELTGAQIRNLEEMFGIRVVDRAALILDIFAQRAQSREGKLQVELAQLRYRLPRLVGSGVMLSRLGAGIGTRGPGESKLEVDRRRIRERIADIAHEIERVGEQRAQRRARRERNSVPVVAIVGYTNAGKSTLLNHLTGAGVLSEDKLFATLDTTTRQLTLPGGGVCLLTDTVGFIDKLPHDLVSAFRSTLEEALYADLLVVVSDGSSPDASRQQAVVEDVLEQLGASHTPRLLAVNKVDVPVADQDFVLKGALPISAKTGQGMEELLTEIERSLNSLRREVELLIPYDQGAVLALLHREGAVLQEEYEANGTKVRCLLDDRLLHQTNKMLGI